MALEVGPEFLAGIASTILLMLLFLMVVVLWDIALALRDVAEKIDYLEDDVDSDLATINGTLTRMYDRMGGRSGSTGAPMEEPVAPQPGIGTAGVGAAGVSTGTAPASESRPDGAPVQQAGAEGARGAAAGTVAATAGRAGTRREAGATTAAAGKSRREVASPPRAGHGTAAAATEAPDGTAVEDGQEEANGPSGDSAGAEPEVDPGSVTPVSDDPGEVGESDTESAGDETTASDDESVADADESVADDEEGETDESDDDQLEGDATDEPSASGASESPTVAAEGSNVGRFASDGSGTETAWYEVQFDLPPGERRGSDAVASEAGTADDGDLEEPKSGTGPFGLQRPGLRSQIQENATAGAEETEADAAGEDVAGDRALEDDTTDGAGAAGTAASSGGQAGSTLLEEDLAATTITDVATVSLEDLHRSDVGDSAERDHDENTTGATNDGSDDQSDSGSDRGEGGDENAGPSVEELKAQLRAEHADEDGSLDYTSLQKEASKTPGVKGSGVPAEEMLESIAAARVELAASSGDDEGTGGSDGDAVTADDVLERADADPSGTGSSDLADAFGSLDGEGSAVVEDGVDGAGTEDDGGDIADLVNRELDTLTQEVGGTSMTPDVSDADLASAVDELDEGTYTFPLSGSQFDVEAAADAETATLRFTPEDRVELGGARERLLKYQLRNYLDRDETAHAELSVDGGTIVLDIPGASGPAVDAWADAAVQIVDRTLYLSRDET